MKQVTIDGLTDTYTVRLWGW